MEQSTFPITGYLKKTFHTHWGWVNTRIVFFKGVRCRRADNIPEDGQGKPAYWIDELPKNASKTLRSWHSTYGFLVGADDVTFERPTPTSTP